MKVSIQKYTWLYTLKFILAGNSLHSILTNNTPLFLLLFFSFVIDINAHSVSEYDGVQLEAITDIPWSNPSNSMGTGDDAYIVDPLQDNSQLKELSNCGYFKLHQITSKQCKVFHVFYKKNILDCPLLLLFRSSDIFCLSSNFHRKREQISSKLCKTLYLGLQYKSIFGAAMLVTNLS